MKKRSQSLLAGALAGFVATAPMTAVMVLWKRRLPWWERESLPPRKITDQMLATVKMDDSLSETEKRALTVESHFGYGTTMGGIFGLLPHAHSPVGAAAAGMAFGLGVWSGSYLAWLPATGLHRAATEEPLQRNLLMLAAHLVWGGSLGLVAHWMQTRKE